MASIISLKNKSVEKKTANDDHDIMKILLFFYLY